MTYAKIDERVEERTVQQVARLREAGKRFFSHGELMRRENERCLPAALVREQILYTKAKLCFAKANELVRRDQRRRKIDL